MIARPRSHWSFLTGVLIFTCGCSTTEHPVAEPVTRFNIERISDEAGVLSVPEKEHLAKLLETYERETTHQLAVVTVKNLAGESIETYAVRKANDLNLGLKGIENGILMVVAPNDRKARIELRAGFTQYISDERAQDIMDTQMIPAFRQQQYAVGIERGLALLMSDGRAFVVHR